ncbi:MAG: NAD(P)/FAD-dependent oxidoreductase [Nitrospiria bacterium]
MVSRDAVIVGGGPAGSTAAWRLKKAGFQVALIDRAVFPRDKVCAGWITPSVVESLELDLEDYRINRVFQPITGFNISLIQSESPVEIKYPNQVSYGIRRYEFDDYLLRRSGAELHLGEPLHSIRRESREWILNESIRTPLLIGAGGQHCPVARFIGNHGPDHENVIIAQEAEFFVPPEKEKGYAVLAQRPELYFCDDLKGYGWCFRKGDYLNIGLGREDRSHLSEHMAQFVHALKQKGRIPQDAEYVFKGHSYLLHSRSNRPLTGEGVMLIGDSAGLAYTESGEGILPAVESGLYAAQTAIESKGHYDRLDLASYELKICNRFGSHKKSESKFFFPLQFKIFAARFLMARQWFVKRVVLDRWFLHRRSSTLIPS